MVTVGEGARKAEQGDTTATRRILSLGDEGLLCRAAPARPPTAEGKLVSLKWLFYSRSHLAAKLECRQFARRSTSGTRAQGGSQACIFQCAPLELLESSGVIPDRVGEQRVANSGTLQQKRRMRRETQ